MKIVLCLLLVAVVYADQEKRLFLEEFDVLGNKKSLLHWSVPKPWKKEKKWTEKKLTEWSHQAKAKGENDCESF